MSSAIQVAKTVTYLPDLVEVQRASFKWFLEKGLIEELDSFSPITDYTGKLELHFVGDQYRLKRPRHVRLADVCDLPADQQGNR
jgi:DNA-directed RNA polymerase subunit beta